MNLRAMLQCPPNQVEDKDPFFIQVKYNLKKYIINIMNNILIFV